MGQPESDESEAARRAAHALGPIEGSSTTRHHGKPIAWAFDIAATAHRHLVLAGAEGLEGRVLLRVDAELAFSGMLLAKAIAQHSDRQLDRGEVTLIETPAESSWACDAFYLHPEVPAGLREHDVLAIALHAGEAGLPVPQVAAALEARAPDGVSRPDPLAEAPTYPAWVRLLRSVRRYERLRALQAPEVLLEKERVLARRFFQRVDLSSFGPLPDDVLGHMRALKLME